MFEVRFVQRDPAKASSESRATDPRVAPSGLLGAGRRVEERNKASVAKLLLPEANTQRRLQHSPASPCDADPKGNKPL